MGTASNQYETQNIRKPIWKPLQLNKPSIFLISPKRKSSKFNLNSNKSNCKENPILEPTQKTEKGEERSRQWLHKKKSVFFLFRFVISCAVCGTSSFSPPIYFVVSWGRKKHLFTEQNRKIYISFIFFFLSFSVSLWREGFIREREKCSFFFFFLFMGGFSYGNFNF